MTVCWNCWFSRSIEPATGRSVSTEIWPSRRYSPLWLRTIVSSRVRMSICSDSGNFTETAISFPSIRTLTGRPKFPRTKVWSWK